MRLSSVLPLDDEQLDLLERVAGRRTDPPVAFQMWARDLPLAEVVEGLLAHLRTGAALPLRLRTLAMLLVGLQLDAPAMWAAHRRQAIDRGIDADALDRLRRGGPPGFPSDEDECFFRFASELLEQHSVSDETYAAALTTFGETGLLEIVACLGAYTVSSYALNAFRVILRPEETVHLPGIAPEVAAWYADGVEHALHPEERHEA